MSYHYTRQSSRMSPASQGEAHQTYLEDTLFEAVVTAGAMMAFADRRADAAERLEFASFVGQSRWMPTFTAADAVEAFDSRVRQFEMASSVLDGEMGSLQRISDDIGIGEIVRVAELIAMVDGCMQPAEVQVLRRVRSAMCRPVIRVHE